MNLKGKKVYIRFFEKSDGESLLNLEVSNKAFFEAYSTTRFEEFYSKEFQERLIEKSENQRQKGCYYAFGIFSSESELLVGKISLFDIRKGPLQSCTIGVYIDEKYNGKGFCTEAVELIIKYTFEELGLHRIEIKIMPRNKGSIKVAEKLNFKYEGVALQSVLINGKWEDHQVFSLINEGYKERSCHG